MSFATTPRATTFHLHNTHGSYNSPTPPPDGSSKERSQPTSLSEGLRSLRNPTSYSSSTSDQTNPDGSPRESLHSIELPLQGSSIVTPVVEAKYSSTRAPSHTTGSERGSSASANPRAGLFKSTSEDVSRSPRTRVDGFASSNSSKNSPVNSSPQVPDDHDRNKPVPRSPLPPSYLDRSPRPQGISPPSSPKAPSAIARAMQSAAEARNPSLDSAMSSSSNASVPASHPSTASTHSHQSSIETSANAAQSGQEAAALIASAGGAEDAIRKLLKEKQATSSRNEQLWRLVEKQRALILGLHQDLERSMKDKERYRKKLKEHIAADGTTSEGRPSTDTQHPLHRRMESNESGTLQMVQSVQTPESANFKSNPVPSESRSQTHRTAKSEEGISPIFAPPSSIPRSYDDSSQESPRARLQSSDTTPKAQKNDPLVGSPLSKGKKAAPAPLDLSQSNPTSMSSSQRYVSDASGSDYDTVEARPPSERGRRRTRAEDDQIREELALEEEQRSASSKKSSKSKSKSTLNDEPLPPPPKPDSKLPADDEPSPSLMKGLGPESPRAPGLGSLQSPMPAGVGSIASALGVQLSNNAQKSQSPAPAAAATLKSPGMPPSPGRPDRQIIAPAKDPTKDGLPTGPLSPKTGLPLSPRAPKYPIPGLQSPAFTSPFSPIPRSEAQSPPSPRSLANSSMAERVQPNTQRADFKDSVSSTSSDSPKIATIYKGFVSDQYPNLLLPPNALPLIEVKVHSSRLRPARHNVNSKPYEDEPVFTLAIHSRSENKQLWRVEKTLQSLPNLDSALRQASKFKSKLPDRSLFSGHAPAKVDARRAALVQFFDALLDTPMDEKAALVVCRFFSTDVIAPHSEGKNSVSDIDPSFGSPPSAKLQPFKEGYLSKKGKQFGGWKARYFILENQQLKYFESPGGQALGIVRLQSAQVGRQNSKEADEEAEFRHAFVVLEPKRKDSSSLVSHVFCAESDQERDSWVEAVLLHIGNQEHRDLPLTEPSSAKSEGPGTASPTKANFQAMSYEDTVQADAPKIGESLHFSSTPTQEAPAHFEPASNNHLAISGPMSGGIIQDSAAWGNKSSSPSRNKDRDARKRSMFGFISRNGDDPSHLHSAKQHRGHSPRPPTSNENRGPGRPVFGIPLLEAAKICPPVNIDSRLPAPAYRCIEYLEAKGAAKEEGIFRLSGSSVVIKALKDRFNFEGDVNLMEGPYTDVHAVASLLKLYLRELPETVLTRELHLDFLKVLELETKDQKVTAMNVLVHKMPEPNMELLRALSRLLITVVGNSDVNKMTSRNVSIVFAPTLNIPGPLINIFLTEHQGIFSNKPDPVAASPVLEKLSNAQVPTLDEIRSPRKQMFSDVGTPGYDQTSFAQSLQGPQASNFSNAQQRSNTEASNLANPRQLRQPAAPTSSREMPSRIARPIYQSTMSAPSIAAAAETGGFGSLNAALAPAHPTPSQHLVPTISHSTPSTPRLNQGAGEGFEGGPILENPTRTNPPITSGAGLGLLPEQPAQSLRQKTSAQRLRNAEQPPS